MHSKTKILRLTALLCAVVMLCTAFSGCKSKKDLDDSSSDVVTSAIASEVEDPASSDPSESASDPSTSTNQPTNQVQSKDLYGNLKGTTVNIPLFAEPDNLTKQNIKRFEKNYGAKIKYTVYGWQEYQTRLLVMVNSGTAPDITPVFDQQYLMYISKNVIQPIAPYVNTSDSVWEAKYNDLYKWGDTQYTVSTQSDLGVFGIYYNKDLFDEYGVDDPYELYKAGKWDFANFRRVAKEMTVEEDGSNLITGFHCWKWDILVLANGGKGISLDSGNKISITLDQKNELTAFELIQDMQLEDKSFNYAYQSADNYFKAGRIAMISERPGYSSQYFEGKFKVGWVPLPKGPDVTSEIAPCIVGAWGVPSGAKNPLGGMAWIYSNASYNKNNSDDPLLVANKKRNWPDKELEKRYDEYVAKATLHTSLIGGCNNWDKSTRWGFWEEIFVNDTPPATAVARHKQELQYEIDQVTKGN